MKLTTSVPSTVRDCCRFIGLAAMAYPLRVQSSGGTTGMTTSHLTRLSNNDSQVIGYSHLTKPASGQVAGYPACGRGSKLIALRFLTP